MAEGAVTTPTSPTVARVMTPARSLRITFLLVSCTRNQRRGIVAPPALSSRVAQSHSVRFGDAIPKVDDLLFFERAALASTQPPVDPAPTGPSSSRARRDRCWRVTSSWSTRSGNLPSGGRQCHPSLLSFLKLH